MRVRIAIALFRQSRRSCLRRNRFANPSNEVIVRVVGIPNFAGTWIGEYRIGECTDITPPGLAPLNLCDSVQTLNRLRADCAHVRAPALNPSRSARQRFATSSTGRPARRSRDVSPSMSAGLSLITCVCHAAFNVKPCPRSARGSASGA